MTAEQAAAVIHPEDRSRVLSVMQNRLDGKDLPPGQLLRSMKKTGEVQWVETLSRRTNFKGRSALEINFMDVTERITAEEAYRSVVENSIQGLGIIQEGRIVFCNGALLRMSGFTREETYRLSPEQVAATVHHEDRERVLIAMNEILAGGNAPPGQQIRMFDRQGLVRWVEVLAARTTFNCRPAVQVSYIDITERRDAEAALRESESRFRELVENAPVAIGISRPGKADYRNRALVRLFGFEDAGELARLSIFDQVAPRFRKEMTERALRRKQGLPTETEFESVGLRKDGSEFPFRAAVTVMSLADGPANVAFITDITAQKDFEQELGDSHLKLRNLATHLLSARESERKSVAREIHDELGQLLTALKMDLSWIEKRLRSSDAGILEKIRATSGLAVQAIDIVHRIASDLRPVMLDDLGLPAAIEWLGGEFSRRTGIACDTNVTIHESRIAGNSATALFRIVQESLSNVGLHSRASHVSILLREADGRFEIILGDDGIGITPEQASAPTSFGLIGIRERVEGLGGELTVQGRKGKGTTVHVTIPIAAESGPA
jgi:PAS domain S-box-containing protein